MVNFFYQIGGILFMSIQCKQMQHQFLRKALEFYCKLTDFSLSFTYNLHIMLMLSFTIIRMILNIYNQL